MSNILISFSPSRHFIFPPSPFQTLKPLKLSSKISTSTLFPKSIAATSARSSWQPPKYVYPDPIPAFAASETAKFRCELKKKLLKTKEDFGGDLDAVIGVCAEILSEFLHKEYGGPGTLITEPFTDMLLALKEKKLPGASTAARAALLWAQNYLDKDWEIYTSN